MNDQKFLDSFNAFANVDLLELAAYGEKVFDKKGIEAYADFITFPQDGEWRLSFVDEFNHYLFSVIRCKSDYYIAKNGTFALQRKADDTFSHYTPRANVESIKRSIRRVAEQQAQTAQHLDWLAFQYQDALEGRI